MAFAVQLPGATPTNLRAFRDISLHLFSGNLHIADGILPSWNAGSSVIGIVNSDHRGHFVDFIDSVTEVVNEKVLKFRCYLQHCQFFKVGPAMQMWIMDELSTSEQVKESYSRTFALRFRTDEASVAFYNAVVEWKNGINAEVAKMGNGTLEPKGTNKFERKIEASSAKMYFHYYGQLLHQQNMLQDYVRTGTYYAAVMENYMDFQGRVVVDVGAGSGILSLFAAQAGAKHVYAVEASQMAEYAQKLISGNPLLAQRITVIHGKIEEVELPEKADILISEPMGTLLVNERMLESYIIARDRFLSPNGNMFPALGRIHMAPFSDEYLFVEVANKALFWQQQSYYGVDLTSLHGAAFQGYFSQPVVDAFDPRVLIAPPAVHTIDFLTTKEEDLYDIDIPLQFTATMAARVHGLACWFDVLFNGSAVQRWLTTAPGAPTTHWYQLRCILSQPLYVMAGQPIVARLHLVAHSAQSYTIHLTMSAMSWGAGPSQVLQTSTGKLDLKEPYYRMAQPQAYAWAQEQSQQQQQQQTLQPQQQPQVEVAGFLAQAPQLIQAQRYDTSESAELLQTSQLRQNCAVPSIIQTSGQPQQQLNRLFQQGLRS